MKRKYDKKSKAWLSKMKPVDEDGHKACNIVRNQKQRAKFGISYCDTYGFYSTFGRIFSNALFRYCADANRIIIREDFDLIAKHAQAIQDYSEADPWDGVVIGRKNSKRRKEYHTKEKAFKDAMKWITKNWTGLWW